MRLLIFHNILFAHYKSVYFHQIYNEFQKSNHQLLVVQTCLAEKSRLNHFNKEHLKESIQYPYHLISEKPLEEVNDIIIFYTWLKTIIQFKPNVINFTGYNTWYIFFTLLICKILGIKTIITNESVKKKETSNSTKNKVLKQIKKLIVKQATYFYTFGLNANNLLFDLGVSKNQIINFGNTFDSEKFPKPNFLEKENDKIKKLLFVGRLIPEKNLHQTIDFLAKVNEFQPLTFHIYGDGPCENSLKDLCSKSKYHFVEFFPAQNWQSLAEVYPLYDFLILFSILEPWGMVANEAQWFGLPVICTSNCGCANDLIIDNFNGKIIESLEAIESPTEIAKFIKEFSPKKEFISRNNSIFNPNFAINSFLTKLKQIDETGN